jgi:hypothetical protein
LLAGVRVNGFNNKMVFPNVQAVVFLAFDGDTWAAEFS